MIILGREMGWDGGGAWAIACKRIYSFVAHFNEETLSLSLFKCILCLLLSESCEQKPEQAVVEATWLVVMTACSFRLLYWFPS